MWDLIVSVPDHCLSFNFNKFLTMQPIADLTKKKKKKRLIKDGDRRPYLSSDRKNFRADTTRPLVKHLGQVSRKSDKWSRRRCDDEIVTVLNKWQLAI